MELDARPDEDDELYIVRSTEHDEHGTANSSNFGLDGARGVPSTPSRGSGTRQPLRAPIPFAQPAQLSNGGLSSHTPTFHSIQNGHVSQSNSPSVAVVKRVSGVKVPQSKFRPLPYATGRSGLVYDVRMRFHEDVLGNEHPEDPRRIAVIFNTLVEAGLAADAANPDSESDFQLLRILTRSATDEEIMLAHSPEHLAWVKGLATLPEDALTPYMNIYKSNSIYVNNLTWLCATLSAGGAIEATKAVLSGQVRNAFACIRPPGHHAEPTHPEGFCFFNNVPIAAKIAQRDFPEIVRKVLILDWDVHHGNGIQREFYDDPNVLYISIHLHENGTFYPSGPYGDHYHCGEGAGRGRNVNIPWSKTHMGDGDYIYAFQQVVMPICVEFDPDVVFISAGFDAAEGDPLGECHVSPACYGHMTHLLMQLAKGRLVSCLEGGYNLTSISKSALSMTRVMMGERPDRMSELKPTKSGFRDVQRVIRQQAKYWKSMYPKDRERTIKQELGSQRLHDIIREWQAKKLWEEHRMLNLFVYRTKLSKSYENQVIATQAFQLSRPLLMVFHDPPEAMGYPDPPTSELELHNTWLTDVSKRYIDWAVNNDFSAIDVNVPKFYTDLEDKSEYAENAELDNITGNAKQLEREAQVDELASYLWDNYIDPYDASHVFIVGMGDAGAGVTKFLSTHPLAIDNVDHYFGFVTEDYRLSGISKDEPDRAKRFYRYSTIFVQDTHPCFDPDTKKGPRKRHGRLVQSSQRNMQEMLHHHQSEVVETLLALTNDWRLGQTRETNGTRATLDPVEEADLRQELNEMDVSRDPPQGGRYY